MTFTTTKAELEAVFPKLVKDIAEYAMSAKVPAQVVGRLIESMMVNATGGKMYRALAVPEAARLLSKHPLDPSDIENLCILGFLVEIWQAYLLVIDDVIDGSQTRRGRPCWFRRPDVGLSAINDGVMLKSSIFILLQKYFHSHPAYVSIVESFHTVSFLTEVGQECDMLASKEQSPDLWTLDDYESILTMKGGYGSFHLSILVSLHYLQLATPCNLRQAEDITLATGKLYQYRNDYVDIFGLADRTGKVGNDITENKCSWVIIHALRRCTADEREFLLENYGGSNEATDRILEIFQSLNLNMVYKEDEQRMTGLIHDKINALDTSEGLTGDIFTMLLGCDY